MHQLRWKSALAASLILVLVGGGCLGEGNSDVDGDDTVDTAVSDAGDAATDDTTESDSGSDDVDTQSHDTQSHDTQIDPCQGVTCGSNASCEDGQCICDSGFSGDPNAGCEPIENDPCENVQCPRGATCVGGNCPCDPGFADDGSGACAAESVSDPASRSRQDVCTRWNDDYGTTASAMWTIEPDQQCDPGVLAPGQQRDALRRLNLFRWLAGLNPVTSDASYVDKTQQCATTLAAHGRITHSITEDFDCYTGDAATAAGSSNLAQGVRNPASSVDLYIADSGVSSLGHRRWSLNPSMGATGFGQRDRFGCMWSFDRSGSSDVDHVFWPPPGFVPSRIIPSTWSMGSNSVRFGSDLSVTIEPAGGGSAIDVSNVQRLPNGYAINTISWSVSTRDLQTDTEYVVTITGAGDSPITYRITPVSC